MRAKRRRRPTAKATSSSYRLSTEEEDNSYSEMDESDEDSDWGEEERTKLAMAVAVPNTNAGTGGIGDNANFPHGTFQGPAFTPDMDPAGPPIFQMAPDMNAYAYGMRSPFIRPMARQASSMQPSSSGAASPSLGSAGDLPMPNQPLPAPTRQVSIQSGGQQQQQQQHGVIAPTDHLLSSGPAPALGDLLPDVPALSLPEPVGAPTTLPSLGGVDTLPGSNAIGGACLVGGPGSTPPGNLTTGNVGNGGVAPGGDQGRGKGTTTTGGSGGLGSFTSPSFMLQSHQGMIPIPQLSVPLFGGPPPATAPGINMPSGGAAGANEAGLPGIGGGAGAGALNGLLGSGLLGRQGGGDHVLSDFDCMSFLNNTNFFNNSMGGGK